MAAGPLQGIVQILGYVLQLASYFVCWRLAFAAGERLPRAFLFGLLASLLATGVFALVGLPALLILGAAIGSGVPFLGLLIGLTLIVVVFAVFYTVPAAVAAVFLSIALVLLMLLGAITGNVGFAATRIGGGSGAVVVMYLVLSVILLWLTTRLSCTTAVMADWKSYNLVAAIRESWRLTLEEQWAIMRYLVLVAFALAALIVVVSLVAGLGATAFLQDPGAQPVGGAPGPAGGLIVVLALSLAIGIPLVLLNALVPAGIYRELTRSSLAAEVFA